MLKYTQTHAISLRLSASVPLSFSNTFPSFSCPSHRYVSLLCATPTPEPSRWESNPGTALLPTFLQLNFSSPCAAFLESPPSHSTPYLLPHLRCGHENKATTVSTDSPMASWSLNHSTFIQFIISLIILILTLIMSTATIYCALKMFQLIAEPFMFIVLFNLQQCYEMAIKEGHSIER